MKILRIFTVICFFMIIATPLLLFNLEEDAISDIDNRELAKNPFSAELRKSGDLTEHIESYISDRIGLRDDMILAYTVLNDRIFGKMVHPSYVYGKDGYVFGEGLNVYSCYNEFHKEFADMILKIQNYCIERNVPFLFVFEPAKPAVLSEYIPEGYNYDREWVDLFLNDLDERGINYIDNTQLLREKTEEGENVFNKKYDANHWNGLGAFYGTNQILSTLQDEISQIHVNDMDDISIDEALKTTLPVSEFPINEMVPSISINAVYRNISEEYRDELSLDENYSGFGYIINSKRLEEGSPRALVFQGSYMNSYGYRFLLNGFGEYIQVHDYQNVIDFSYYFNIFKPDCVVFEVAEYTISDSYFNSERMETMNLNPTLENAFNKSEDVQYKELSEDDLIVKKGNKLTEITWKGDLEQSYGWLKLGEDIIYDFTKSNSGYETTILTDEYEKYRDDIEIITSEGNTCIYYQ